MVTTHPLSLNEFALISRVIPGFTISMAEIFA